MPFPSLEKAFKRSRSARVNHTGIGSRRRLRHRQLGCEPLEDRRLLSINYPTFSDSIPTTELSRLGSAGITDNVLRLAPSTGGVGAAWFTDPQVVSVDFEATFQFQLSDGSGGPGGSEGFAFVIQNNDPHSFSEWGGCYLGYTLMPNSLAVEFDTYLNELDPFGNELGDPSHSHVGVHTGGAGDNAALESYALGSANTSGFLLDDGSVHTAKIQYTPGDLNVYVDDLVNPVLTVPIDLADTLDLDLGRAWVGFTAATGGDPTNHDILNWHFSSLADDGPVIVVNDINELEGAEGDSTNFQFTVSRFGDSSGIVTVDWSTVNGTAIAGSDFQSGSGHVMLSPGEAQKTFEVAVLGDDEAEGPEEFFVELSNAFGAEIADGIGRGVIDFDDTESFTIVLMPDTQNYSTGYPHIFDVQSQWIIDNKETENFVFVSHLGDVVNDPNSQLEWERADTAIDILDGRATDATLTMAQAVDLMPYGSADLAFDWFIEGGFDKGEYLALDLFDGTTWHEVAKLSGNLDEENTWHHKTIEISGGYLVDDFNIRFRAKANRSDEDANVDNVQLFATSWAGPPNEAPLAVDDNATADEDVAATIGVLLNDSDPDNDPINIDSVSQGANSSVVDNHDGTVTYTPNPDFNGSDSFTYTISDGRGGTATATVGVDVTPIDDAPIADSGGPYTVPEAGSILLDASASSDPDLPSDTLTYAWDLDYDGVNFTVDATGPITTFDATGLGVGSVIDVAVRVTDSTARMDSAVTTVTVQEVASDIWYNYTGDPRNIGDLKTLATTVDVPDTEAITSLLVRLNITHASPDDLVASLISPNGIELTVIGPIASGNGFYEVAYPGTLGPGDLQRDGTWALEVTDGVKNRKRGTLIDWSLVVTPAPLSGVTAIKSSAAAVDLALLAWLEHDFSEDHDTDPLVIQAADHLALMLVE